MRRHLKTLGLITTMVGLVVYGIWPKTTAGHFGGIVWLLGFAWQAFTPKASPNGV